MRLQTELHKTIVFVTHDFDEAVKLGDRIAVLGPRSTILQYDTPDANPGQTGERHGGRLHRRGAPPSSSSP